MFRALKDIFKKEEVPFRSVTTDEVPALLAARQMVILQDLMTRTGADRQKISDIRDRLLGYITDLASAEMEEAIHPKLEKVAKNSLPQFKKAMHYALQRSFPDDPQDFYHSAGEMLKGCVKSLAGQGRYLQGVFPEEMRFIRTSIDELGRSVNAMTPLIAESRKMRDTISAATAARETLLARCAEYAAAASELPGRTARLESARKELEQVREQLSGIRKGPGTDSLALAEAQQELCQDALEQDERHLRSVLSVIVHVYRKGEKISGRSKVGDGGKEIRTAIEAMVSASPSGCEEVINRLHASLAQITSMIGSGEIQLKNREERDLFGDPARIPENIRVLCERVNESAHLHGEAVRTCHDHPLNAKIRALNSEQKTIGHSIEEEESRIKELRSRCELLTSEIPVLTKRLAGLLSTLEGQDIRLEGDCTASLSGL